VVPARVLHRPLLTDFEHAHQFYAPLVSVALPFIDESVLDFD